MDGEKKMPAPAESLEDKKQKVIQFYRELFDAEKEHKDGEEKIQRKEDRLADLQDEEENATGKDKKALKKKIDKLDEQIEIMDADQEKLKKKIADLKTQEAQIIEVIEKSGVNEANEIISKSVDPNTFKKIEEVFSKIKKKKKSSETKGKSTDKEPTKKEKFDLQKTFDFAKEIIDKEDQGEAVLMLLRPAIKKKFDLILSSDQFNELKQKLLAEKLIDDEGNKVEKKTTSKKDKEPTKKEKFDLQKTFEFVKQGIKKEKDGESVLRFLRSEVKKKFNIDLSDDQFNELKQKLIIEKLIDDEGNKIGKKTKDKPAVDFATVYQEAKAIVEKQGGDTISFLRPYLKTKGFDLTTAQVVKIIEKLKKENVKKLKTPDELEKNEALKKELAKQIDKCKNFSELVFDVEKFAKEHDLLKEAQPYIANIIEINDHIKNLEPYDEANVSKLRLVVPLYEKTLKLLNREYNSVLQKKVKECNEVSQIQELLEKYSLIVKGPKTKKNYQQAGETCQKIQKKIDDNEKIGADDELLVEWPVTKAIKNKILEILKEKNLLKEAETEKPDEEKEEVVKPSAKEEKEQKKTEEKARENFEELDKLNKELATLDAQLNKDYHGTIKNFLKRKVFSQKKYLKLLEQRDEVLAKFQTERAEFVKVKVDDWVDKQLDMVKVRAEEFGKKERVGEKFIDKWSKHPKLRMALSFGLMGSGWLLSGTGIGLGLFGLRRAIGGTASGLGVYRLLKQSQELNNPQMKLSSEGEAELKQFVKENKIRWLGRKSNKQWREKRQEILNREYMNKMKDKSNEDISNDLSYFESQLVLDGKNPADNPIYKLLLEERSARVKKEMQTVEQLGGSSDATPIIQEQEQLTKKEVIENQIIKIVQTLKLKFIIDKIRKPLVDKLSGSDEEKKKTLEYEQLEKDQKQYEKELSSLPEQIQQYIKDNNLDLLQKKNYDKWQKKEGDKIDLDELKGDEWQMKKTEQQKLIQLFEKDKDFSDKLFEQAKSSLERDIQRIEKENKEIENKKKAVWDKLEKSLAEHDENVETKTKEAIKTDCYYKLVGVGAGMFVGTRGYISNYLFGEEAVAAPNMPKPVMPVDEANKFATGAMGAQEIVGEVSIGEGDVEFVPIGPEVVDVETIGKGEGILHALNRMAVDNEYLRDLKNNFPDKYHEWRVNQLKNLGFEFKKGSWGYPVTVHEGAEVKLIRTPDGGFNVDLGKDNVNFHDIKWTETARKAVEAIHEEAPDLNTRQAIGALNAVEEPYLSGAKKALFEAVGPENYDRIVENGDYVKWFWQTELPEPDEVFPPEPDPLETPWSEPAVIESGVEEPTIVRGGQEVAEAVEPEAPVEQPAQAVEPPVEEVIDVNQKLMEMSFSAKEIPSAKFTYSVIEDKIQNLKFSGAVKLTDQQLVEKGILTEDWRENSWGATEQIRKEAKNLYREKFILEKIQSATNQGAPIDEKLLPAMDKFIKGHLKKLMKLEEQVGDVFEDV